MTNALRKRKLKTKIPLGLPPSKPAVSMNRYMWRYLLCHSREWQILWEKFNSKLRYPCSGGPTAFKSGSKPSNPAVSMNRYRWRYLLCHSKEWQMLWENFNSKLRHPCSGVHTAFKSGKAVSLNWCNYNYQMSLLCKK